MNVLTVKNLREKLNELGPDHDDKPICCWINSQSPVEPIYSGCARIPAVHVDVMEGWNTIDLNCEAEPQVAYEENYYRALEQLGIHNFLQNLSKSIELYKEEAKHVFSLPVLVFMKHVRFILMDLAQKNEVKHMSNLDVVKYLKEKLEA